MDIRKYILESKVRVGRMVTPFIDDVIRQVMKKASKKKKKKPEDDK